MLAEAVCPHCGQNIRAKIRSAETTAILDALQRGPLGTHELAIACGFRDYGSLHQRLRHLEQGGLIETTGFEMRRIGDAKPGRQRIWRIANDALKDDANG